MITDFNISKPISNHPNLDAVTRKVESEYTIIKNGTREKPKDARFSSVGKKQFYGIVCYVIHEGLDLEIPITLWATNDKNVDPTNGRVLPALVEDTDENSETFGEQIPDPSHNPTVPEFTFIMNLPIRVPEGRDSIGFFEELKREFELYIDLLDDQKFFNRIYEK